METIYSGYRLAGFPQFRIIYLFNYTNYKQTYISVLNSRPEMDTIDAMLSFFLRRIRKFEKIL